VTLLQALQIGARNSFEFQTQKESVFRAALDLDLERQDFRTQFFNHLTYLASLDRSSDSTMAGGVAGAEGTASRSFQNGIDVSGTLAVDLASLWQGGAGSSLGLMADASISVPLMRGSGRHIVTESLTLAEREVIYTLWEFERYRRTFAVDVWRQYLSVLQQQDSVVNARHNYESLIRSARWSRRRADAGRLTEIEVDQARQNELGARNNWISAQQSYEGRLDTFKGTLGLPPDAAIELDTGELEQLRVEAQALIGDVPVGQTAGEIENFPSASAAVDVMPASFENAGPFELAEDRATALALNHRLDLQVALRVVEDAQRQIVVRADALRAELTLLGTADMGSSRSVGQASTADAQLRPENGSYSALLTLDLPFERTEERNAYRKALIDLEQRVRDVQRLEDDIKSAIRKSLRDLVDARESLRIQALSTVLAEKRVASSRMFVQAGRSEIRNLLEAQNSLLSAQNSLTSALVTYRISELELQRDMGLLQVNQDGRMVEFRPGDLSNDVNG
jgi:outer membrane protein TolC